MKLIAGSIYDSKVTEECGAVYFVESEHETIDELYAVRDITLNRSKQNENWGILNFIWPINRIVNLSSAWQTFAHIVNLTNPPIGPKELGTMYLTSITEVYC